VIHDSDLDVFEGKRVRVIFKDGRKSVGTLQRDLTGQCWEILRADVDKAKTAPPGVGEILFLQEINSVEEFTLK
jgi:hypothetical protein